MAHNELVRRRRRIHSIHMHAYAYLYRENGYKEEGRASAEWRSGRIDIHERDSRLSQVHG